MRGTRLSMRDSKETPVSFQAIHWRRLFAYLKPYRGRMALAVLALLISTGLGLAFPMMIVRLLDSVTHTGSMGALNGLAMRLAGIFLLQAAFSFLQSSLLAVIGEHIVCDLRTTLYNHLHHLSLDFYAGRRVGEIVSRLSSDVTQMRTVLTSNVTMLLGQSVSLVGALAIVATINTHLTLFILALFPALILVAVFFGRRIQKISTGVQDQLADSTTVAEEALQGIRVVKSFGREPYERERYGSAIQKAFRASVRMAISNSLFATVMMFLGFGSIAAIMWYGGREVIAGRLTLAMINGFLMYGIMIAGTMAGLAGLYGQFRAALGGVQRVFEILDMRPSVQDAPDAEILPAAQGHIRFDNVTFQYEPNVPVIRGITLDISAGEILALVGPSGAGKSTLFNLIPRFYDPAGGSIQIDGHDLRSVTQESLRAEMAMVPQETMLFGGTIRENILYGRLDATEAEMIEAARAANAHDFVMEFPLGYETIVGERGAKLSGGQRQRIAVARAILKNPRILLLDEATSSLDNDSEGLVQDALNRLMEGRTTVIIAHRLSTIKVAHRIAVLNGGRIVELGTHHELMRLDGLYAHLYSMQFRDPAPQELGVTAVVGRTPRSARKIPVVSLTMSTSCKTEDAGEGVGWSR
jgi:ATP-binding cassette, subfamily B, bacterial MsbA